MVWVGCLTCRTDQRCRKWEGFWCDEEAAPHMTVYDVHQPGNLPDIDDHVVHIFSLEEFGIPFEQGEAELAAQTDLCNELEEYGLLYPMAVFATFTGQSLQDVNFLEFRARYAGEWHGRPTRAARKRFLFTRAGDGVYYLWRRHVARRSDAMRRAVQV